VDESLSSLLGNLEIQYDRACCDLGRCIVDEILFVGIDVLYYSMPGFYFCLYTNEHSWKHL